MKHGIIKYIFLYLFLLLVSQVSFGDDKIQMAPIIDLDELPATFEEDKEILENNESYNSDENKKEIKVLSKKKSDKIYVNLKALDKITAKTSSIKIAIGEKKYFGKLEIKPLKCQISDSQDFQDTIAYLQVKDLSLKDNNQVFVFNGWTFSSSPTLRSIDHPVYDLWLVDCDNI